MWAGISVHMFVKFFEVKIMKMKGLLKKVIMSVLLYDICSVVFLLPVEMMRMKIII